MNEHDFYNGMAWLIIICFVAPFVIEWLRVRRKRRVERRAYDKYKESRLKILKDDDEGAR